MKHLIYKSFHINIKSTLTYSFLIETKELAEVCYVFESLILQTKRLNPSVLLEEQHYISIEDSIYWTKEGIIRLALLLSNCESIEFANYLEKKSISRIEADKEKEILSILKNDEFTSNKDFKNKFNL